MSIVATTEVAAFAHCGNRLDNGLLCPGNEQQPVRAFRDDVTHSYLDGGGDLGPFPERGMAYLRVVDPEDEACPFCSLAPRVLSEQRRPVYPKVNASDPIVSQQNEVTDLRVQLAELRG